MTEELYSESEAFHLLKRLEHILECDTLIKYKSLIGLQKRTNVDLDEKRADGISASEYLLESEVMKHSKVLLLLSCDFGTAWNARKLIAFKKQDFSLFIDELSLSALILSYSPKSEQAWSHRRWVIRTIHGKYPNIQDIVERESELVKKIAEKSKMNYRAWSYRCWLITYMTSEQVLNQLKNSRKWSELHVGDSSCFHYRQHLLSRMMAHNMPKHDSALSSCDMPNLYRIWIEELEWDAMLINSYIGRESLWVHRRFLCQFGIKHFFTRPESVGGQYQVNLGMENFINGEIQLVQACLNITYNEFEDGKTQETFAAVYILWILKHLPESLVTEIQDKLRDYGDLKSVLNKLCPEKALVWDGLMN